MKSKINIKVSIIVAISITLTLMLFILLQPKSDSGKDISSKNISITNDVDRTNAVGDIAFGVLDSKGSLIDNGSTISINDEMVEHSISIDQYLTAERDYLILVFIDFIQQKFIINSEEVSYHKISLNSKDSKEVTLKVKVPSGSSELTYLIIKKPEYKFESFSMNRSQILREVMAIRFDLGNPKEIPYYENNVTVINEGPFDSLNIIKDSKILSTEYLRHSEEEMVLSIGNSSKKIIDYAVIALLDWEQVSIVEDDKVTYFRVNPEQRQVMDITLPDVNDSSNFQMIAFPFPYNVSRENYKSMNAEGSFRITIND